MKKQTSLAVLTPAADRSLKKLALLIALIPLAVEIVVLFPILQIVNANIGNGVLYQILSVASRILNLTGYFAAIALSVYCVFADALGALGRTFALQSLFRLLFEVVLRTFLLWLLAVIDNALHPSIALSNFTLNSLTENNGQELLGSALFDFLGVVVTVVLLAVIIFVALLIRRKHLPVSLESLVDSGDGLHGGALLSLRVATLIYLIQALANQIYSTFTLVSGIETSALIANIGLIAAPYFLLAIYAFAGYRGMLVFLQKTAERTLALCSNDSIHTK